MGNKSNKTEDNSLFNNINNNKTEDKSLFKNIKSQYILEDIVSNITEKKLLKIIKYNKCIQKRLNKNIDDYKYFYKIILEGIPGQKNFLITF